MTLTAPTRSSTDTICEPNHGAHIDCQLGRPTVKTICGIELDWDDQPDPGDASDRCVVCLDLLCCPICGIRLANPA